MCIRDSVGESVRILWSFHHAILDGRSFPLVLDRVLGEYVGGESLPEETSIAFAQYAHALSNLDTRPVLDVWGSRVGAIEDTSTFALSSPEEASGEQEEGTARITGEHCELHLDEAASMRLVELADRSGVSLNNVIQAAWALLLHHYSQNETVAFGSTRACRHLIDSATDTIGLLINTVPFILEIGPGTTVRELLESAATEQRALRDLEAASFADIQGLSDTALFDSIVMFDSATLNTRMMERRPELDAQGWEFAYTGQTNFALTLLAYGEPELLLRLEYDRTKYAGDDAGRLLEQLFLLLRALPESIDAPAVSLPYLTAQDHERLASWNDTGNDWDLEVTLMELLEAQVERTPDAPAIAFRDEQLTFDQFNRRVNQFAHYLRANGVGPDLLVGVCAERSIEMEVAIHAIMKAGGAFVPLDPELPDERLAFMVKDAQCSVVVSQSAQASRFASGDFMTVVVDDPDAPWSDLPESNPEIVTRPDQLAYALFTSGSTGTPKCAMNEHRGIVNRVLWMQDAFPLDKTDTILQKTPFSFDVSVWEHVWSMMTGARLVMAEPGGHKDPVYLAETIVS